MIFNGVPHGPPGATQGDENLCVAAVAYFRRWVAEIVSCLEIAKPLRSLIRNALFGPMSESCFSREEGNSS